MELVPLYRSLLTMTAFKASEDGTIYTKIDGHEVPVSIEGKGMTLPTPTALKNAFVKNQVIFHPLNENAAAVDKPVFKRYLAAVVADLNATVSDFIICLSNLAATPENQTNLPQEALEILADIGPVDKAFAQKMMIMSSTILASEDVNVSWVKIYMKRNGKVKGSSGRQAAIVSFPILELIDKEDEVCSLKIRKKDREPFKKLFMQILNRAGDAEWYNHVSDSQTCPSMDALMGSVKKIYESLIDFTSKMPAKVADLEFQINSDVNMDWCDAFNNIEALRTKIITVPATTVAAEPVAAPAVAAPAPVGAYQAPGFASPGQPLGQPQAQPGTFAAFMQSNPQMAGALQQQSGFMPAYQAQVKPNPIAAGFNSNLAHTLAPQYPQGGYGGHRGF